LDIRNLEPYPNQPPPPYTSRPSTPNQPRDRITPPASNQAPSPSDSTVEMTPHVIFRDSS
jgi:hypothetical protein